MVYAVYPQTKLPHKGKLLSINDNYITVIFHEFQAANVADFNLMVIGEREGFQE